MFQTPYKPLQIVESNDSKYYGQNDPTPVESKETNKEKDKQISAVNVSKRGINSPHIPQTNKDEFHLFGQTVAEQLRQLPLETALETEEMVLAVIRKQRVKLANRSSSKETESEPVDSAVVKVEEDWWESSCDTNAEGSSAATVV